MSNQVEKYTTFQKPELRKQFLYLKNKGIGDTGISQINDILLNMESLKFENYFNNISEILL